METVMLSEFKRGMVRLLKDAPRVIEEFHSAGTAKFKPKLHVRLRHLTTGHVLDRTFADNEQVPVADLEHRNAQFSYKEAETYVFLEVETYEQLELSAEQIGERRWFLKENEEHRVVLFDARVVDVVLPTHVVLEVTETGPVQRGSSDTTWKPARLETGLEVLVPLFIATGERIRVDTNERKYVGQRAEDRRSTS